MVRAYDYLDSASSRSSIQSEENYDTERMLAKRAAERASWMGGKRLEQCPGCHQKSASLFFTKWGVDYLRCGVCRSVYTDAAERVVAEYRRDEALAAFRASDDYQDEAAEKRAFSWQETVDWIGFRSRRYLGEKERWQCLSAPYRFRALEKLLRQAAFCESLTLTTDGIQEEAEIALSFDMLQQTNRPISHLQMMNRGLRDGGLLFLSARTGTGFDILTLREHAPIYPYEYVSLLSREGLENLLAESGFSVLDYSTPGAMDVSYVNDQRAYIATGELFVQTLMGESDEVIRGEFQRFLQRSGMSSYVRIVARKVGSA